MEKMRKHLMMIAMALLVLIVACKNDQNTDSPTTTSPDAQHKALQERLLQGWNTWDNRSIFTHVLLPDEFALIPQIIVPGKERVLEQLFPGNRYDGLEVTKVIGHAHDASYTGFSIDWEEAIKVQVETSYQNEHLYMVIAPREGARNEGEVNFRGEFIYNKKGKISVDENKLKVKTEYSEFDIIVFGTPSGKELDNMVSMSLKEGVVLTTDTKATAESVKALVAEASKKYQETIASYGDEKEVFNAVSNALNWTVVYDHRAGRLVSPVSRSWAYGWGKSKPGGFVLFCWDNFFAAYMHSLYSKDLAFNEAIQMCNEIDDLGFVPNYSGPNDLKSRDRSQPPVGSAMVKEIYRKYPEKWFLEYNFDKLLRWNRWWKDNRVTGDYLTWGSDPYDPVKNDKREVSADFKSASNESGLDNTPMYDGIVYDTVTHLLRIADVGLTSMYVMDCEVLADIAKEIGREKEEKELRERAGKYRDNLKNLWDDDFGLFLNMKTDTKELSKRISPTNFYALQAKSATQHQAEVMMEKHFYNPDEFWGDYIMPSTARNDTAYTGQDYWRGSIWAPMNFLVYLGMQNYDLPEARKDLSDKSKELLLKNWNEDRLVRENYHAETGGAPEYRCTAFYNWGALLGMITLIEEGHVPKPMADLNNSNK